MRPRDKGLTINYPKGPIDQKTAFAYQPISSKQALTTHFFRKRRSGIGLLQPNQSIEATGKEMLSIGVVGECRDCAVKSKEAL
jgi:hypothetical protein